MRPATLTILALSLAGCPKDAKAPASNVGQDAAVVREMPPSLEPHAFTLPPVSEATLSNGLVVKVVENHEVPTFDVRLMLRLPDDADVDGKQGTTSLLFSLMDEGAGDLDAETLGRTLKTLGGSVGSGAGTESASVYAHGPVRNLEPLLDLWADVLLRPALSEDEWSVLQPRAVADRKAAYDDPGDVAGRVGNRIVYGDDYRGDLSTPATLAAVTLRDLRAAHDRLIRPDQAVLFVGGDVTLDQVVPVLEARLGSWTAPADPPAPTPTGLTTGFDAATLYVVDMPGAAQSVVRAFHPVSDPRDAGWWNLTMANTVFGGAFTARVNMDLREDKGWTYGARCALSDRLGDALWLCYTNVQTDKTGPALAELQLLMAQSRSDMPFTDDELAFFRGYLVNGYYGSFETPRELLGELADLWLYDLPPEHLEAFVPGIEAVDTSAANAAWAAEIDPDRIAWLIVGDLSVVGDDLAASGLPIVELDKDGRPVAAE